MKIQVINNMELVKLSPEARATMEAMGTQWKAFVAMPNGKIVDGFGRTPEDAKSVVVKQLQEKRERYMRKLHAVNQLLADVE